MFPLVVICVCFFGGDLCGILCSRLFVTAASPPCDGKMGPTLGPPSMQNVSGSALVVEGKFPSGPFDFGVMTLCAVLCCYV